MKFKKGSIVRRKKGDQIYTVVSIGKDKNNDKIVTVISNLGDYEIIPSEALTIVISVFCVKNKNTMEINSIFKHKSDAINFYNTLPKFTYFIEEVFSDYFKNINN